jgi:succinate-semialdehyde dehydrogenase/glutarate-semialdehyde dehydrogenase
VGAVLARVSAGQPAWAARPVAERAEVVRAIGAQLRKQAPDLAVLMTAEMGKPIGEARAEVEKSATACDYYAEHGPGFLAPQEVDTGAGQRSWVAYEPIGVVLAVMPWNFPFWQVLRFAAPTLLAGNTAVLKHSPNVTGCALAIEQAFADAGVPADVFRSIVVAEADVPEVSRALIEDDRVAAVSLTGSERAGAAVAEAAGRVVKKSLLELGGSDPFVVLADADLDLAVAGAVKSRFINSGQSCLAAKRFVVHQAVAGEFTRRFAAAVADLRVGDPRDETTVVGPLARADLREGLSRQVRDSVAAGARVLTGGSPLDGTGAFFAPTVLAGVTPDMPVMAEETFGPVARGGRGGRRRRGRADRERHPVRARGQRLERRPRARPGGRPADHLGGAVRQRRRGLRPAVALRRHSAQRLRPRARTSRRAGVHQRANLRRGGRGARGPGDGVIRRPS